MIFAGGFSVQKEQDKNTEKGKILILELDNRLLSMLICQNQIRLIQAKELSPKETTDAIGSIYVGKVHNIAPNIGAAFVEIQKGTVAFLPLAETKDAVLTNRKNDGTLKAGDELLVQLVKEPVKTKPAALSAKLSLSGSYAVIENRIKDTAGAENPPAPIRISSKLGKKHHQFYKSLEPLLEIAERFNIVIRTNAANAKDSSEVAEEAKKLAAQMEHLLAIGDKRVCFSCLYRGEPDYISFIKNCYQSEYDEIVTDNREIYETLLEDTQTNSLPIRYYEDSRLPLYKLYSVETKIQELLGKKVWLKSGAYLVIEQTEALVSIDVNTGKYEAKKNPEETYFKINLEAAEAIAAALRARNLSGMILVDFINMKQKEHTEQLTEYMKSLLRKDATPAYVVDITGLGLMEITRKKKNRPFAEQMRRHNHSLS